jgi:hypothetical protein
MDHQLKLTARGHAVYELMADLGLSLEAACARIDHELESLRLRLDTILAECAWDDAAGAMQQALDDVSVVVQNAYLEEESARIKADSTPASSPWHHGAFLH